MKKNQSVIRIASTAILTAQSEQKPSEVRKLMQENQIHHVPVVDGTQLVGLVSALDLANLSLDKFGSEDPSNDAVLDNQLSLEDIMSKNLVTLQTTASIREAAELLAQGNFHSLPIIDEDGNLRGLVTSTDLIRYLLKQD